MVRVSPGRKAHRPRVAYVPPSNWQGLSGKQWHGAPVLHSVRSVPIGIGVAAAADGEPELEPVVPPQADRTRAAPRTTANWRFLMPITGTGTGRGLSAQ